jgi:hypothetical protein
MPADFEFVARHEMRRTDDYLVEFDEYRRPTDDALMLIAHIRVFRWAPSVLKRMRREWDQFRTICKADVYASPAVDEPKWHKMVRAVGFKPLTTVRCLDGLERPMYINRISDGHEHINNQHQQQQHQ